MSDALSTNDWQSTILFFVLLLRTIFMSTRLCRFFMFFCWKQSYSWGCKIIFKVALCIFLNFVFIQMFGCIQHSSNSRNLCKRLSFMLQTKLQVPVMHDIIVFPNEYMKVIIDHRSYAHNLTQQNSALNGFESMISAIQVQCSNNWAFKPNGSWSHCEFVHVIYL